MPEPHAASEELTFGIIATAGAARSAAFEALRAAQADDFEKADTLMAQSREAGLSAHERQTQLLTEEARGNHVAVDVMLVHAQDHLMTAMLAQDLITEMIRMCRERAQASGTR